MDPQVHRGMEGRVMHKTFKFRLYPSPIQERLLSQTLETCRIWYNVCLAQRRDAYEQKQRRVGKYEQLAWVKDYRKENPYAAQVHSHVIQVVVADLDKAFQAFFRRVKAGEKPGYPRFKGRDRFDSFGFKEYKNGFKIDGRRLRIYGVGRVAVRWHRPVEGRIKTLRIRRSVGKWYACFSCEVEPKPLEPTGREAGIDVGITHLIATSDGDTVPNPGWYREEQRRLRVAQRRVARRKKGGANRRKAVAMLQRQHEHIKNRRKDFLDKLAAQLLGSYDRIAVENLNVCGMARNHHLSKAILDSGWAYFRQRLDDKAEEAGRLVVGVNPAYTSKTCSDCGTIFEGLTLSDRWVSCGCGLSLDRDHNAALNILRLGQSLWGLT
jgi:putative transposase